MKLGSLIRNPCLLPKANAPKAEMESLLWLYHMLAPFCNAIYCERGLSRLRRVILLALLLNTSQFNVYNVLSLKFSYGVSATGFCNRISYTAHAGDEHKCACLYPDFF